MTAAAKRAHLVFPARQSTEQFTNRSLTLLLRRAATQMKMIDSVDACCKLSSCFATQSRNSNVEAFDLLEKGANCRNHIFKRWLKI